MRSYNTIAEQRIEGFINDAIGEGAPDSHKHLKSALDILSKSFNHNPLDSDKDTVIRFESINRINKKILEAYDLLLEDLSLQGDPSYLRDRINKI